MNTYTELFDVNTEDINYGLIFQVLKNNDGSNRIIVNNKYKRLFEFNTTLEPIEFGLLNPLVNM